MGKFYRRLLGLTLLVAVISGGVIYSTVDVETLGSLTKFRSWSLALALIAVALGMFFDGSRLMHLVRVAGERISLYEAVQVIFGNYFLAMLTPGATGGAVAQLIFLRHAGVPTGKAAVLVIVRTFLSIFFLACCMPFIFFHDKGLIPGLSNTVLMAITAGAFLAVVLLFWAAKRGILDLLTLRLTKNFPHERRRKVFSFYRDTKKAARLLFHAPRTMLLVFFESGLNLLCIYAIVPCLLLGLGVTEADWCTVMGRMICLNMLLYFTPTPGGSGVAEGGFVFLFDELAPLGTVGILAVCWRLIAEYLPFVIGFYYTVTVFGRDFLNRQLGK
ncbi:MAG: flippase-like domain-containing protein [Selenomonadaceae bacterium]|nr:flippase-like domain-containing protein [Selenomonadaceae bacterium]